MLLVIAPQKSLQRTDKAYLKSYLSDRLSKNHYQRSLHTDQQWLRSITGISGD